MTRFMKKKSAVARAARLRRSDGPTFFEFSSDLHLSPAFGLPVEVVDLIERTEMLLRVAMAVEAPTHALRLIVPDDFHVVHRPMTAGAANPAVHVHGVIKIHVIRGLVDADPFDWNVFFVTLTDNRQLRALLLDERVALHTCVRCGHVRVSGNVDERMAVAAVHLDLPDM